MTQVSQLPAIEANPHTPSQKPGPQAGQDEADFGDMLRDPKKAAPAETRRTPDSDPPPDRHWAKLATARFPNDGHEVGKPAAARTGPAHPAAGKSAVDKAEEADGGQSTRDKKTGRDEDDHAAAPTFQEKLPLLMTLHDLRRLQASGELGALARKDEGDAAPDGKSPLAKQAMIPSGPDAPKEAHVPPAPRQAAPASNSGAVDDGTGDPSSTGKLPAAGMAQSREEAGTARAAIRFEPGRQGLAHERITVVAEQNFPAPAQHPGGQTVSHLVDAIASDNGWRQALSAAPVLAQPARAAAASAHVLKIELHPAELGMVTASLHLVGEQLSVELKPENHDAYHRLSSDKEAIVKSLRGMGFDIDTVTVLQPSIAVAATARPETASPATGMTGRDQSPFQPGGSGNNGASNGDGNGSQQSGRNRSNDGQDQGRAAMPARGRIGGDLFI